MYTSVTPFVGVWIETENTARQYETSLVTPFVGVWIETFGIAQKKQKARSHPSWVCGLKQKELDNTVQSLSHTLRGCVD